MALNFSTTYLLSFSFKLAGLLTQLINSCFIFSRGQSLANTKVDRVISLISGTLFWTISMGILNEIFDVLFNRWKRNIGKGWLCWLVKNVERIRESTYFLLGTRIVGNRWKGMSEEFRFDSTKLPFPHAATGFSQLEEQIWNVKVVFKQ